MPRLVAQLQARDHSLKLFVINLFQMPIERIENECVYLKRRHAMVAFDALGSEARSAIPELMALFASDNAYVPGALAGIGSDAMPALTNALVSRVPFVAGNAARAIGAAVFREKIPRSKAQVVFPALLLNLKDENPHTRKYAAEALGDIGTDPSKVVPALVELLSDSEPSVRAHAASALRGFRESALTALPALTNALTDPDPTVRQKAAAALQAIDEASLKSN